MKKAVLFCSILAISISMYAQPPMGGGMGKGMNFNMGRMYGKLIDSISGKPVEYAALQVFGNKYDTTEKKLKYGLLTGDLSKSNGDFNLTNLPVMGKMQLKINALGYKPIEMEISFNLNMGEMMKEGQKMNSSGGDMNFNKMAGALNAIDKDLGNIQLVPDVKQLKEVTITDDVPDVEIKLDKKIYNVDKDLTVSGGTGEDVLKNVPAVTVDMDGNVNLRNSSPQIFVDGRPTTLTVDQIPADAIEKIEVITNPSAKYDASGGTSGIINIVLKKNRRIGYNGSVRAGIDSRGRFNGGGDFNVREGKFNFFISGFANQRKSRGTTETVREDLIGTPKLKYTQISPNGSDGLFAMGRGGFDYFMNNRNTITLSGMYVRGKFNTDNEMENRTDSIYDTYTVFTTNKRYTLSGREFQNVGGSLLFKHLFPQEGRELTSDFNFNANTYSNFGDYETKYYDMNNVEFGIPIKQKQTGSGGSWFLTAQSDYVHPLGKKMKLESGIRASAKNMLSKNSNFILNPVTNEYIEIKASAANFTFSDQVYAAYSTFSHEVGKFTYQAGLRLESFVYSGKFIDSTDKYYYRYPVSPFPSIFGTYKINDKNDLQLSYSRRIQRPGFFQMIPATDFSDSLNITRGNPGLKPEFTNSMELTFMHYFTKKNMVSVQGFYKYSEGLISSYQYLEYNTLLQRNIIINSYENANKAHSYGTEIESKWYFGKVVDVSGSANFYYSMIDASNIDTSIKNDRFNWFARARANVNITKKLSFQINGNYTGKSNLPLSSGGRGGMTGNHAIFFGSTPATAQGYTLPVWWVDAGLKFTFMKEDKASLTLNVQDIFRSRINITHTESTYFVQDVTRTRDQLLFRLNFSYRFGKFDVSLFKRKNMNMNMDGMEMGM